MAGFAVGGGLQVIAVLFPELFGQASATIGLPAWLHAMFSLMFALGGAMSMFGVLTARVKFEAAGLTLLSSVLVVWFGVSIYVRELSALPGSMFLLFIAIGCWRRAHVLMHGGYDDVIV